MRASLLSLVLAIGVSADASAQICYAENDGPAFNDGVAAGGPSIMIAVRFSPLTNFTATGLEVFTGEATGTNTVSIWSTNGFTNEPLAPLGTGSWEMDAANQWQGATLSPPVPLTAGTLYWMVWSPQGGAQSTIQSGVGLGQLYRGSFDGGATWTGPFQNSFHWKFRIECCPGFFEPYGLGCTGTSGVPVLAGDGCPTPGDTITIEHSNMLPGAPALFLIGSSNAGAPINPFCFAQNLPWVGSGTSFTVGPLGTLTLPGTIPITTITPVDIYLQTLIGDSGAYAGVASTNPLRVHIE